MARDKIDRFSVVHLLPPCCSNFSLHHFFCFPQNPPIFSNFERPTFLVHFLSADFPLSLSFMNHSVRVSVGIQIYFIQKYYFVKQEISELKAGISVIVGKSAGVCTKKWQNMTVGYKRKLMTFLRWEKKTFNRTEFPHRLRRV